MRMDSKHIEQLLEKYWSCETSLEEEKQLREYFRGEDIPGAREFLTSGELMAAGARGESAATEGALVLRWPRDDQAPREDGVARASLDPLQAK